MNNHHLYVAWQDEDSREWIPVAKLARVEDGYLLNYTRGAKRCKSFAGLGRMAALDKSYFSERLFPFFANRMISKSRPEYKNYLKWLGLDDINDDPMNVLSVTGGLRATDSFELIPPPYQEGDKVKIDLFPRGLRYLPPESLARIATLSPGDRLYLMLDIQNSFDSHALLLRTDDPKALVGYLAKYYCTGLVNLLTDTANDVIVEVKRINEDAPLDMRLLCTLTATWQKGVQLLESESDFLPWSSDCLTNSQDTIINVEKLELGTD